MSDLKVGDRIKDNDPRVSYRRVLTIIELLPFGVKEVERLLDIALARAQHAGMR